MDFAYDDRVIAGISTPPGEGGISVVRMSGEGSFALADALFKGAAYVSGMAPHTLRYGKVTDPSGRVADQVIVSRMDAPRTYTREDTVEISSHGGDLASGRVLALCLSAGARLAQPGEFTMRAFLNGRIDLTQAEAVMDLIKAKSDLGARIAVRQLEGGLGDAVRGLRRGVLAGIAAIEVGIDFPEHGEVEGGMEALSEGLGRAMAEAGALASGYGVGRALRDGLAVAIAGKPNVGKSSVMNRLCGGARSIVDASPGTTRDVVEDRVSFGGVPVRLMDTAGIRGDPDGGVESVGIGLSVGRIGDSDLVLFVVDASAGLDAADLLALSHVPNEKPTIVLINKSDLPLCGGFGPAIAARLGSEGHKVAYLDGSGTFGPDTAAPDAAGALAVADAVGPPEKWYALCVSALTGLGFDALDGAVRHALGLDGLDPEGVGVVTSARHRDALDRAVTALREASDAIAAGMPADCAVEGMRRAARAFGSITGEDFTGDLVGEIFSGFCVGK
ncbi:MAG: tRNA uridine-5-carboxymethylaminomethyl(34) synthesis GTPase MnmE [Oscillospiraceae bacterium]|nr:tRNA uridine-5-carboxymethylaminomethyl(34) synthesis GTPase MnmE [Oscillospiraceae bacterium]